MKSKGKIDYRPLRPNAVSITLSDKELAAIDEFCKLFRQKSRAAVIREGAIRFVRERLIDKHSELFSFDEEEEELPLQPKNPYGNVPSLFDDDVLDALITIPNPDKEK